MKRKRYTHTNFGDNMIKKFILIPSCIIWVFIVGIIYQSVSTKIDHYLYPPPGKKVDIGGYSLHINIQGSKGPTVILDAGMGLNSLDWSLVQPKIAEFARVCSFDRAGYGWSDLSPLERTSQSIVEELHHLLIQAKIPPPYILVGHSFGGVNMRLFASYYPHEVFGVVLVESSNENQLEELPPPLPPSLTKEVFLSKEGYIRLMNHLPKAKEAYKMFPKRVQKMYLATNSETKAIKANIEEQEMIKESLEELKRAGGYLGDRPLIVITAGMLPTPEEVGLPEWKIKENGKIWDHLQKELLTKSTRSEQMIAKKSNHMVPRNEPEIIVKAIKKIASEYSPP